ncbi:NAD(P)/FAD-dependent oxidoreductase [Alsobacter sp. R-9]
MSLSSLPVAVVGAGIAGLAAARRLADAGRPVVVVDKGRGLGGRMATRRVEGFAFDHGAQFFRVRGPAMGAALASWSATGAAAPWFDDAMVGLPGMTAPARAMAAGLDVRTGVTVSALSRGDEGWRVATAEGPLDHPANGRFGAVVLAVPAPQGVTLAASAGIALPAMAAAVYAPCWALMLGFLARVQGLADHLEAPHEAIGWVARNASKPGRGEAEAVVVHASPAWSRAHLERRPEEIPALLAPALAAVGIDVAGAVHVAAHRWRYALVERAAGVPFLHDPAGLWACGDWCLGGRVEAAFDSGHAAGGSVLETLA